MAHKIFYNCKQGYGFCYQPQLYCLYLDSYWQTNTIIESLFKYLCKYCHMVGKIIAMPIGIYPILHEVLSIQLLLVIEYFKQDNLPAYNLMWIRQVIKLGLEPKNSYVFNTSLKQNIFEMKPNYTETKDVVNNFINSTNFRNHLYNITDFSPSVLKKNISIFRNMLCILPVLIFFHGLLISSRRKYFKTQNFSQPINLLCYPYIRLQWFRFSQYQQQILNGGYY